MYRLNIEALSLSCCRSERAISVTCSECVSVALVIQHAKRIYTPYFHLWPVWFYRVFSILSHKRYDFREKVVGHIMCVLIFCTSSV